jgi:ABC-2 type transport system permease protein
VFEGMRALMRENVFETGLLLRALALNAVYLTLGMAVFLAMFKVARRRGLLLNMGE